jgi:hypothetical protein
MPTTTDPLPFGHRPAGHRVESYCNGCGQVDDHPKHHTIHEADGQVAHQSRHMDCCAADGCAQCAATLTEHGNAHGDQLVKRLTKGI